jgi:integrase
MERAYARLSAEGLSPSSVGKVHRLVRQACMRAAVEGVLERDPTVGLKAPRRRNAAEGINALDREGRARLLSALASMERTPLAEAALVALYTGLRQGEVCGLRWSDYDEGAGVLWVRRSIGRGGGACYVKEPKNGRSRDVAVPARLAEELAAWRAETAPASPSCYVLSGTADFYSPERVCHGWTQLSAMLGLVGTAGRRCTFHDLRHTWATVAVASGVDIKTVASNLGHANAAMTLNVYASADPEAKRRAAETVGAAM